MSPHTHDRIRSGVRAAVYHACWRRLDGDDEAADAILAAEVPAALAESAEPMSIDDASVRAWLTEDRADFERAVLISDLVTRRAGRFAAPAADAMPAPGPRLLQEEPERPRRAADNPPAIADLLEGMLIQERKARAAS